MQGVQVLVLGLMVVVLVLQVLALRRRVTVDLGPVQAELGALKEADARIQQVLREEIKTSRDEAAAEARGGRQEVAASLHTTGETLATRFEDLRRSLGERLDAMRESISDGGVKTRGELAGALKASSETQVTALTKIMETVQTQLEKFQGQIETMTTAQQARGEELKQAVEGRLKALQEDNTTQLEKMRVTVDEKLQGTLEKRLGESFQLVSERLESVQRGLGEMQALASGVGDLKKVLTNVKTRGTWGEVQLGALLEQVLSPQQYAANVSPRNNGERVEFAVQMPGRSGNTDEVVWLPIDAKFPVEDYQRLTDAQEAGDMLAMEIATQELEVSIKHCAKTIADKYIEPPHTTDFAILFLPTEGLFAEVIRRRGLVEQIQQKHRVIIAGPTTLWSILSSLQMGFRTLAIQRQSSEVWRLLGAVKTEWGKYSEVLDKVKKQLETVAKTVDTVGTRSRAIERKLRGVEELPSTEAALLLPVPAGYDDDLEAEQVS